MTGSHARALPTVVLVGRPNVGKSTLFNRITRTRRAIVNAMAGTTRDVMAHDAEWLGMSFRLVDTGGIFGHTEDPLHDLVVEHGKRAILQADLVIFVVDGREGRVSGDDEIAAEIRRVAQAPVLLAVNKADDKRARDRMYEFFAFGFDHVFEIAAEHGTGVHDLMDAVQGQLKAAGKVGGSVSVETPDEIAVAIVGRPNVGKSSLVNRLLREERLIVSDIPGTTRDAIDTLLQWHKRTFRIVDTAGIRRPGRVASSHAVEMVSVLTAKRAMERADVAVLVIDASQGATDQDAAIAGEAERLGCGMIIAANKWDLTKGEGDRYYKEFDEEQRFRMKFLEYAPLLHISALTGERATKLLETVDRVAMSRRRRITTGELNRFVERVGREHPPSTPDKRHVKILYAAQTGIAPPQFVFFTNVATEFHFSYERFLVNSLRDTFGFEGTPIRITVRKRGGREREKKH
ncbi:GTP-binding protein EngA [Luteitalea pratensis]|uniref:GTPase Der n=1 Tax=Luteitalea pratensis TaxID=1855912 RepID=A0A143PPQ0_LUTPR|nr:ribosome biogenesis GTPase Der [Luteitalea pratensis]AMY10582.1 GTP-binding protein EngA [Luteitalea pratensis]